MDVRDVIHATQAFLDEFDAAGSDDEPPLRRSLACATLDVSTTLLPRTTPDAAAGAPTVKSKPQSRAKRGRVGVGAAKKPAATAKQKVDPPSSVKATAKLVNETVPLAQPKTRKEELEFMRDQVAELEEKLRLLKRSANSEDRLTTQQAVQISGGMAALMTVKPPAQPQQPKRIASMWEELAMRQYQQRQRAEVENLKLKSSLEDQLKVAKSLQRMLKRSKTDVLTSKNHAKRGRVDQRKSAEEDASEFAELSATVTDMYARIDDAFADDQFATADVDFRDVIVAQDEALGTTIEVLSAKMVPFEFRASAQAIWDYFVYESFDLDGYTVERNVKSTDDVVMKSFRMEFEVKRQLGHFRCKIAGQRFREKDRVVIVWATRGEPTEVSNAPMNGILVRQRGWTVVKKPRDPVLNDDSSPVAMMQNKSVAVPTLLDDNIADPKRKLDLVSNYVLHVLLHHMEAGQQTMENSLFQSCLKNPPDAADWTDDEAIGVHSPADSTSVDE